MKKKNKEIIETDGKLHENPQQFAPSTLDEVWGYSQSKFGTLEEEVYKKKLAEMNRPALEAHARSLGIIVPENTERLKGNCIQEFKLYIYSLKKPVLAKIDKPISPAVQRILNEGKGLNDPTLN